MNAKQMLLAATLCLSFFVSDASTQTDGGLIVKSGSYKGKVAIVNAQSRLSPKNFADVISKIDPENEYNIVFEKAPSCEDPTKLMKELGANFALIVVDDPKRPLTLIAPDDHWALVNVAGIDAGLKSEKAKARFFEGRCRRQILRIFALAAGGGASQYQGNLTSPGKLSNLDFYDESIPLDVKQRNDAYFPTIGVTKKITASYFIACQEGWAPAPTNDCQKEIWDAIRNPPEKPLKIKFDPATQKGKVTK